MANWVLPLITGIVLFILTIGIVITAIYYIRKGKMIDVLPNAPIINMAMRKGFTEGHILGIVKTNRQNKNNTHFFQVYPLDKKQGEGDLFPKLYEFVVSDDLIQHNASGEYSDYREIIKILPRSNADLPKKMRNDSKDLEAIQDVKEGQVNYLMKQLKPTLITAGDEAIKEMLDTLTRTGISHKAIAQLKEETAQFRKTMSQPRENKPEEEKKA